MLWAQIVVGAVAWLAAFTWMALALGAVLAKLGLPGRDAWIPVLRYVTAARGAQLPTLPVWISRGIGAVGWIMVIAAVLVRAADAGAASASLATFAWVGLGIAVLGTAVGWALWIVAANHIELRLAVVSRLWWLAALLPPAWATIVGFGSARPVVAGPIVGTAQEPEPEPQAEADDATRAIQRVAAPVSEPAMEPAPTTPATPREDAMSTEPSDITSEQPRAYSPYDAPPSRENPAAASDAAMLPQATLPWRHDEDDDATFFAKRRRARWVLRVVNGEDYDLEDVTTIGREGIRPIPGVLPIIDDTRTISKLHARLRRESDNWFVTDLGSTNGTFVRDAQGAEIEVPANSEAKVVGTLLLGDLEAVIVDQREIA